jgi:hypothetical protein
VDPVGLEMVLMKSQVVAEAVGKKMLLSRQSLLSNCGEWADESWMQGVVGRTTVCEERGIATSA